MPRKQFNKDSKGRAPTWVTTFSDLMTLLLTFFVLLFSFSELDAVKFKNMAIALQSVLMGETSTTIFEDELPADNPIPTPIPAPDVSELESEIREVFEKVKNYVEEHNLSAQVSVKADARGVVIDIKERVLFDLGKADIKPESKIILDKLSLLFEEIDKDIVIEGHTDNLPINTYQFPTNWELSTTRAVNVLRYFVEIKGADPTRISATGYGEYRPLESNDTYAGKAANRRVNILLLVYDSEYTI
ncbi:MAG: OmpA family protein [Clostridia bacterium]|nr:OmpA family protein [Clostridia bacterium]